MICEAHSMPHCRICNKPEKQPFGTRRKPLKRSPKRRPMKPDEMHDLIQKVLLRDGYCVAADHDEAMCDGDPEAHHLIPQRVWKAHYRGQELSRWLADERGSVSVCRTHHDLIEMGFLHLPDEALPIGFWALIREAGFEGWYEAQVLRRVA